MGNGWLSWHVCSSLEGFLWQDSNSLVRSWLQLWDKETDSCYSKCQYQRENLTSWLCSGNKYVFSGSLPGKLNLGSPQTFEPVYKGGWGYLCGRHHLSRSGCSKWNFIEHIPSFHFRTRNFSMSSFHADITFKNASLYSCSYWERWFLWVATQMMERNSPWKNSLISAFANLIFNTSVQKSLELDHPYSDTGFDIY